MDEMRCTKENLSKTIKYLEDHYEILDVKTVTGYFSHFFHILKLHSKDEIMASEAQKVAKQRNWQIYMFRGMAYRICQLTRNLSDNKLSTKDKITIVKFNEIMHKQIDYLDSVKKHRHSYGQLHLV